MRSLSRSRSTSSTLSEQAVQALITAARPAFDAARALYMGGVPGPYVLDGQWSLQTYEALALILATHCRLVELVNDEIHSIKWMQHPEARLGKPNNCENGLTIEIAHANEPFAILCREVITWTSSEDKLALLSLCIRVDTAPPYEHDPRLRVVVRDAIPNSTSAHCRVYKFGHGSSIGAPRDPHSADTPTAVVPEKQEDSEVEGRNLEFFAPADAQADMLILELPIGAALFHDLTIETHADDVTLRAAYVDYSKGMKWRLDLGYLRHEITKMVQQVQQSA